MKKRAIYMKGWYYEKVALNILRSKLGSFFYIKCPPNYAWDLTVVFPYSIMFVEVKYTEKDYVYIPKRKIIQMKNYIRKFTRDYDFIYIVIVFFGSKYNYAFRKYDLKQMPSRQIVIQKSSSEISTDQN